MKIRPAEHSDVPTLARIIGHHASEGLMLPRSYGALTDALSHYVVADQSGEIVGCGGLEPYSAKVAEIYGLATARANTPRGTGSAIVKTLIERARVAQLAQVFALTLVPGFFQKMGFRAVEHRDLPMKVWKDCVSCPKFGYCDEIAMVLDLN